MGKKGTQKTQTEVKLPDWVNQAGQDNWNNAKKVVAENPYQAYPQGQRVPQNGGGSVPPPGGAGGAWPGYGTPGLDNGPMVNPNMMPQGGSNFLANPDPTMVRTAPGGAAPAAGGDFYNTAANDAATNQRVADFTPDQLRAMQQVRGNQGIWSPYVQSANQAVGQGQDTLGMARNQALQSAQPTNMQSVIGNYVSPYAQDVISRTTDELRRNDAIQNQATGDAAQAARAYGGSRHGVVDAERERNLSRTIGDMSAGAWQNAFNQGLSQFNTDRGLQNASAGVLGNVGSQYGNLGSQYSGLGGQSANLAYGDAAALSGQGAQQQAWSQQNLNNLYNDWQQQQQHPYFQQNFLSGILNGTPYGQTQTTSQQNPGLTLQSGLGLGLAGAGTAGLLGWSPFGAAATGAVGGGLPLG